MAKSLWETPSHLPEFRAPPPSPVAGVRRPESPENDEFAGFLGRSPRIPKLSLPDRVLPREATLWDPPEIDMQLLVSTECEEAAAKLLRSSAASFGCFQIVNHGIPSDVVVAAEAAGALVFGVAAEKKRAIARSPERRWGFEVEEEGEGEGEEFLWWCEKMGRSEELAGIWTQDWEEFRCKMEELWIPMEKIASKIEETLLQAKGNGAPLIPISGKQREQSVLHLHKHGKNDDCDEGVKHEVLRMLLRSSSCSHALSLNLCGGASGFHIFSKRGWIRFCPMDKAIVVTLGDQLQASTGGLYKKVVGKPVYRGDHHSSISMTFIHSHPSIIKSSTPTSSGSEEKTVSIAQQVMIAACVALLYHFIAFLGGSM
ncbi:flavonol synthase/flavanone 3-hydroxylase [Typha latifolia]|uniref:flavonol synthase/flavanone 3-hydroxylase n=1 Tax=Typha latifolia TaxID=4733 RepID=UPI003C2C912E